MSKRTKSTQTKTPKAPKKLCPIHRIMIEHVDEAEVIFQELRQLFDITSSRLLAAADIGTAHKPIEISDDDDEVDFGTDA